VTVVIDVGCAEYPGAESVRQLVERFKPSLLYGIDPAATPGTTWVNDTRVIRLRAAAWTEIGEVGFDVNGMCSKIGNGPPVSTLDLALIVRRAAARNQPVILKLDCEGAEYELLEYLLETGDADHLDKVLVEWHGHEAERRDAITARLNCPVEGWQ